MVAASETQARLTGKNYPRWYDALGSTTITVNFYSALDRINGDTPTNLDKDAKYIQVITDNTWKVSATFLAAVGAISKPAGAQAWAQATSAQCFPTAMMLCNPSEPLSNSNGDTSSFNPTKGQQFIFSTTGNTGGYSPGVFNLLDTPEGDGSDAAIKIFLSKQTPTVCFTAGTNPAQGQKTNATNVGINVRFDQQPNGNTSGLDLTPAPITIDGKANPVNRQGNRNCNQLNDVSGLSFPMPPDPPPFQSVGGSGGSQIGPGVALADLQAYWSNHHPIATFPFPAGATTRWEIYQAEVALANNPSAWLTDGVEPHGPVCAPASTEVPPEFVAERRILHVAVVDCLYWGVRGNSVNDITINTYADFFVTNPTPQSGPNAGQIYTEFVQKHQVNTTNSKLHRIVQLVR
jgi:hypothetical protein